MQPQRRRDAEATAEKTRIIHGFLFKTSPRTSGFSAPLRLRFLWSFNHLRHRLLSRAHKSREPAVAAGKFVGLALPRDPAVFDDVDVIGRLDQAGSGGGEGGVPAGLKAV